MKDTEVRIGGAPLEDPGDNREGGDASLGDTKPDGEKTVQEKVVDALRQVYDPEIPVNIYDLGLIYEISVDDSSKVDVKMTLTSPSCPVAESLPVDVRAGICRLVEVTDCEVELVWDPPWGPDRMSDVAKVKLGMF